MKIHPNDIGLCCILFCLSCGSERKTTNSGINSSQASEEDSAASTEGDLDLPSSPKAKNKKKAKSKDVAVAGSKLEETAENAVDTPDSPSDSKTQTSKNETEPECLEAPSSFVCTIELEVAKLSNIERQKAGLDTMAYDPKLAVVAREWSTAQGARNEISHEWFISGELAARYSARFGEDPRLSSENVAMVPCSSDPIATANTLVKGWMQSEGHRANILRAGQTRLGVGIAVINEYCFGTQEFGL